MEDFELLAAVFEEPEIQQRPTAKGDRQTPQAAFDNAMVPVMAALSAGILFAAISSSPVLPVLEPNIFLSMALSP